MFKKHGDFQMSLPSIVMVRNLVTKEMTVGRTLEIRYKTLDISPWCFCQDRCKVE